MMECSMRQYWTLWRGYRDKETIETKANEGMAGDDGAEWGGTLTILELSLMPKARAGHGPVSLDSEEVCTCLHLDVRVLALRCLKVPSV